MTIDPKSNDQLPAAFEGLARAEERAGLDTVAAYEQAGAAKPSLAATFDALLAARADKAGPRHTVLVVGDYNDPSPPAHRIPTEALAGMAAALAQIAKRAPVGAVSPTPWAKPDFWATAHLGILVIDEAQAPLDDRPDHAAFTQSGVPPVILTGNFLDASYHRPEDVIGNASKKT